MRAVTGAVLRALACRLASRAHDTPADGHAGKHPDAAARRARDLRPDGRRQDRGGARGGRRAAAAGEHPVAVSADALQVYSGLETLTGVADARRSGAPRTSARLVPADRRDVQRRAVRAAGARRDRRAARRRRASDRHRRHRALPARRARGPRARPAAAGRGSRHAGRPSWRRPGRRRSMPAWLGARRGQPSGSSPTDRHRIVRALALLDLGELEPPEGPSRLWTAETRRPTRLIGLDPRPRGAVRADRRTRAGDGRGGSRARRSEPPSRRGRVGDGAQGARLRRAARGRRRGDAAPHAQLRQAPADLDAQARGRRS